MRNAVHGLYKKAAETVLSPLSKSQFEDKRVLTPQEFVQTGDFLVRACPTWSWEGGEAKKRRPYLPPDKQYLVTRGVPSTKRATELERYDEQQEYSVQEGDTEWVATHGDPDAEARAEPANIPSLDATSVSSSQEQNDAVPDITDLELQDDEAAPSHPSHYLSAVEPEDNIVRTRTYDLHITYDQYYQVPRFWLSGFDESRRPLTANQILQDVSEEHARKTITVEPHPHTTGMAASIHPCRHADVMRRLAETVTQDGGSGSGNVRGEAFTVDHYLILFLKFIASVVPTIEYDYTMAFQQR